MIEAVMLWNEPNNKSHWDFEIDPEWNIYADMVKLAAQGLKAEDPSILRVLGGISPIDPSFLKRLQDFEHGYFRSLFTTPEDLHEKIQRDIGRWLTSHYSKIS